MLPITKTSLAQRSERSAHLHLSLFGGDSDNASTPIAVYLAAFDNISQPIDVMFEGWKHQQSTSSTRCRSLRIVLRPAYDAHVGRAAGFR